MGYCGHPVMELSGPSTKSGGGRGLVDSVLLAEAILSPVQRLRKGFSRIGMSAV